MLQAYKPTRVITVLERGTRGLARFSYQRGMVTLIGLAIILVLSAQGAKRLSIDTDMIALLPESFRSVQDLEKLKTRYGGSGNLAFYIHGAPNEVIARFASDLEKKVRGEPWVRSVDAHRPNHFFEMRGLYFMSQHDLTQLRDQLAARVEWERLHANPLYLGLSDEPAPEFDLQRFTTMENKYMGDQAMGWVREQGTHDLYRDEKTGAVVVMVRPVGLASDLEFCKTVVSQSEKIIQAMNLVSYHPGLKVELTGRFKKRIDRQNMATGDIKLASIAAALLMLLYLAFHFRRVFAIVLIYSPLLVGLFLTFSFAGAVFDSLNVLTGLIGAVLLGLGVDHGIHLLGSYEGARSRALAPAEALEETFGHTGRAVLLAALTTAVGFSGPALSEFRAFHEFGTIAAAGMLLIVFSYIVLMPALLGFAERLGWQPQKPDSNASSTFFNKLARRGGLGTLITISACILLAFFAPQFSFNYDFGALQGGEDLPSVMLDDEVNRILGHSQNPMLVMAESREEAVRIGDALRKTQRSNAENSTIDFLASQADLVPTGQLEKKAVMDEIYTIARKVKSSRLDRPMRRKLRKLKKMAQVEPFTAADLPKTVLQRFETIDGSTSSGFLLVYPRINLNDGQRLRVFSNEIRNTPMPGGKMISAAGEAMVLADILEVVFDESPPVMLFTMLAVFTTCWFLLGNLTLTLLALLPAAMTMLATFGLVALTPVHFDYLNIVMIPVLFGLGVDGGIHIVTRFIENHDLALTMQDTGRAIGGALFTSALGFGAMFLTTHPGLRSLAALSLVGLAVNLLSCLVGLPSILALMSKRSSSL